MPLEYVIRGAIAMGFAVAGGFFLRYWRVSGDRLFGFFAIAFFTLSANRVLLVIFQEQREHTILLYTVRLAAFILILAAIVDKNFNRAP